MYNLLRIATRDKWKTACSTKQRLFEYAVMPIGLTNGFASFQEMMDAIFKEMEGYVWYLDDILIYSGDTEVEHCASVEKVLPQCVEHGLAMNLPECECDAKESIFLVHVINGEAVMIDHAKLDTMSKWPIATKKK